MARLSGTNVQNNSTRGHQAEDGYASVGSDGYTVIGTTMQVDSVFDSFVRTGTGLWTATLKDCYWGNCQWFDVVPQIHSGDSPSVVLFQLLSDNVGSVGTTVSTGAVPQVIHWKFCNSSGTAEDLPANAGFKYSVGLVVSSAYTKKVY